MPLGRETTSVPAFLCSDFSRLPPDVEAGAEQVMPGIGVVAGAVEAMLATGRFCAASRFWAAPLARYAVVLVAARRCPDRAPTPEDLVQFGLDKAAALTSEASMASAAERLGLPG